jgi:hypothetical protein
MSEVQNIDGQSENVSDKVPTKSTIRQVQAFEIEYDGNPHIFDISVIKEPIKQGESLRSLRDYKETTTKVFVDIPINDLKSIQKACDFYISSLFQPPTNSIEIKSKIIDNLSCFVYYENNKWQTRLKYQDGFIPRPLPVISSKEPLYKDDPNITKKLIGHLLNDELIKKFINDRDWVNKVTLEIQSLACLEEGLIDNLKLNNESEVFEEEDIKTTEEKEVEDKNKIEKFYGKTVFKKALELIKDGQAQKFIIQKHSSTYAGISDRISWALSCVFASTHTTSSVGGVHLKIGGPSGNGKNTLVTNFANLTPPTMWRLTSPSAKNMFYCDWIHPDMVIIIDEFNNNNLDLITTMKLSTSRFQDKTLADTVAFFESKTLEMPERIAFIILSVEPLANEELNQRCLTVDVPGGEDYLKNVNKKQKGREQNLPTKENQPDFDTQVCKCIFSILNLRTYEIRIPFAPVIEWRDVQRTRNWELFADLIKCSTYYNILNREYFFKPDDPETGVYLATYDDYLNAVEIYNKLSDNNVTKLSDKELKIINVLIDARKNEISELKEKSVDTSVVNITENSCAQLDTSDFLAFGAMYFKDIAKLVGIPDKQIEYAILGKNSEGLVARVFGLHCEKVAVQGIKQTYHKWKVWYDGPDQIISNIAGVQREMCDMETQRCKQQWLKEWQIEDGKWNPDKAELAW